MVDAPLSGASMCVDQDEDWECDVQPADVACPEIFPPGGNCFTEPSGTSAQVITHWLKTGISRSRATNPLYRWYGYSDE